MKKHINYYYLILISVLIISGCNKTEEKRITEYVNPFIGTAAHGHTFPGACLPFGMVQLSPDNGTNGWDWCSGYNYSDSTLVGFSHKHLSGTGIGDLADILILPVSKDIYTNNNKSGTKFIYSYQADYSHKNEFAEPGYYSVLLENLKESKKNSNIKVELTTTKRVGFHKYTYSNNDNPGIIIDLGFAINWDAPTETFINIDNKKLITGYRKSKGWANDQHVYFAIELSEEITDHYLIDDTIFQENKKEINSRFARAFLKFNLNTDNQILLKVGLSPSNIEGAIKNLKYELPGWDFESVKLSASEIWENELKKIQVESSDISKKEIFYTAAYHSYIAPTLFSDVDGTWRGIDREIHKKEGFDNYTVFSLWDTFRALHPLFTITQKDLVSDLIQAMLVHYEESGQLPIWSLEGCETNCMIGYHSIPVIVDAYFKGIDDFDVELAYKAMKESAERDFRGLKAFTQYGYIPADLENESVSKALEYCFDDWCIAQMAKALGKEEDYQRFNKRAGFFRNHFDLKTGFMRGKNSDGNWKEDFNPLYSNHREDEYTEGNAWQYSWFVPHDVKGLIELHRGAENFVVKLDSLFEQNTTVEGENSSADISGLIGQYAHGNEPSHHVAYLYSYAGKPWKTQERVNEILSTLYKNTTDGISGNDDCGQMSAWYVLSSIGFYPVNPANGNFVFGRPVFDKVTIKLDNDKTFTVIAENVSDENMYIQSVSFNGNPYSKSLISYKDIMSGGELKFIMDNTPNKEWGSRLIIE